MSKRVHLSNNVRISNSITDPLYVIVDSSTPVSQNITQLNGNTIATNSGITTNGTQRISVATDDGVVQLLSSINSTLGGGTVTDETYVLSNPVSVNSGANDVGTRRMTIATDDLLTTTLSDINQNSFEIRRYNSSTKPSFQIYSEISNYGSGFVATNTYSKPDSFDTAETSGWPVNIAGAALDLASASSADTSLNIYIEGYDADGVRIIEKIALDATDAQTVVTTTNTTFIGITTVKTVNSNATVNGIVSVARTGLSWTSGNPPDAICQIVAGTTIKQADINVIRIPPNKNLVFLELEIGLISGTQNQQVQLIKTSGTDVYGATNIQMVQKWSTSIFKAIDYNGGLIIPFTGDGSAVESYLLRVYSLVTDATGSAKIRCVFTFEDKL
jgi:hypothetical protein